MHTSIQNYIKVCHSVTTNGKICLHMSEETQELNKRYITAEKATRCNLYTGVAGWTSKESWLNYQQGHKIHLFSKASNLAMGYTQPPLFM